MTLLEFAVESVLFIDTAILYFLIFVHLVYPAVAKAFKSMTASIDCVDFTCILNLFITLKQLRHYYRYIISKIKRSVCIIILRL